MTIQRAVGTAGLATVATTPARRADGADHDLTDIECLGPSIQCVLGAEAVAHLREERGERDCC